MNTFEYIAVGIFLLIIGLILYKLFQSLYYRYFSSYDKDVQNYLEKNGLTLSKITVPEKENWVNSPFKVPPKVEISLAQIRILGIPVSFNSKEYRLVLAKLDNGKIQRIWMEVNSQLFRKPEVTFIQE